MKVKYYNYIFSFIIIIIFFSGLRISEDYGITVDENACRSGGLSYVKYISDILGFQNPGLDYIPKIENNVNALIKPNGMIFEIPAIILEEILDINEKNEIFFLRHKITFIFHFAGIISFFFFSREIFCSNRKALFASMIYCLHPRIFAHSFFNPKDIIFLSMVSVCLYPSILFLKTESKKWMIFTGICIGLAMSVRIVGIYLPFLVILFFFGKSLIEKSYYNSQVLKKLFYKSMAIIFLSFSVLYIVTPYYWVNPFASFFENFSTSKNFPWTGNNFFFGEYHIASKETPWYYIQVWFGITTPTPFLFFFILGLSIVLIENIKSYFKYRYILFSIVGLFLPIFVAIFSKSTLYDGWRHFFFTYVFSAVIISFGIFQLIELGKRYLPQYYKPISFLILIIVIVNPLYSIIKMHPNQQVYYNFLAGKDPMKNFEGDYWGNSYRYALEWLNENVKKDSMHVLIDGGGWKNVWFIDKDDRKRIIINHDINPYSKFFSDRYIKDTNYYITNFRGYQPYSYTKSQFGLFPYDNEIFSIRIGEMKIVGIYKLNN